jgi:hypothetical protein
MTTPIPTESDLARAIASAAETAIRKLFAEHPGRYYYLSLITTGEAHPPVLAAWSQEALEDAVKKHANSVATRWVLKWSYADSPYFCFGEEFFEPVRQLFAMRPDIHSLNNGTRNAEYELRLGAMEAAMSTLDQRGLFGLGKDRHNIVINVEVMPPDYTNTLRAMRLNPPEAARTWLEEAAEKD